MLLLLHITTALRIIKLKDSEKYLTNTNNRLTQQKTSLETIENQYVVVHNRILYFYNKKYYSLAGSYKDSVVRVVESSNYMRDGFNANSHKRDIGFMEQRRTLDLFNLGAENENHDDKDSKKGRPLPAWRRAMPKRSVNNVVTHNSMSAMENRSQFSKDGEFGNKPQENGSGPEFDNQRVMPHDNNNAHVVDYNSTPHINNYVNGAHANEYDNDFTKNDYNSNVMNRNDFNNKNNMNRTEFADNNETNKNEYNNSSGSNEKLRDFFSYNESKKAKSQKNNKFGDDTVLPTENHIESDSSMEDTINGCLFEDVKVKEINKDTFQLAHNDTCVTCFKDEFIFSPCSNYNKDQLFTMINADEILKGLKDEVEVKRNNETERVTVTKTLETTSTVIIPEVHSIVSKENIDLNKVISGTNIETSTKEGTNVKGNELLHANDISKDNKQITKTVDPKSINNAKNVKVNTLSVKDKKVFDDDLDLNSILNDPMFTDNDFLSKFEKNFDTKMFDI